LWKKRGGYRRQPASLTGGNRVYILTGVRRPPTRRDDMTANDIEVYAVAAVAFSSGALCMWCWTRPGFWR
jgi:hypothetical protein